MATPDHLDWPFLEPRHKALALELDAWATAHLIAHHGADVDQECRKIVRELGEGGWLKHAIGTIDTRAVCLIRETLARHSGLADFAFAMQGLGSGPISLFGTPDQKQRYLPRVVDGSAIAAFAISEPD